MPFGESITGLRQASPFNPNAIHDPMRWSYFEPNVPEVASKHRKALVNAVPPN